MNAMTPELAGLEAVLDFYVEAGVDAALDEIPHDRFAEEALHSQGKVSRSQPEIPLHREQGAGGSPVAFSVQTPARTASPLAASQPPISVLPEQAVNDARERAASATTLDELERILASFDGCALKFGAKNLVFADGSPNGRVMLVGEAPGADEDRLGRPFVGRSGQLLDLMLAAIGLDRSGVYIANVIPWRPPGNRTPTPQEVAICKPFIVRQIELAAPDILVTLGGPATQALLDIREGILKTRGRWFSYQAREKSIQVLAALHPAYLLRQPLQKRLAWRDMLALRQSLDNGVG